MVRFIFSFIVASFAIMPSANSKDIVIYDAFNGIGSPVSKTAIVGKNGIAVKNNSGVFFFGNWDFSKNLDFEIEIQNNNTKFPVFIRAFISDNPNDSGSHHIPQICGVVDPDKTSLALIAFPPPIPIKAVADKMSLMRADPFLHGNRETFPADYSKIKSFQVCSTWTTSQPDFVIKKIVAKNSSSRKYPKWYSMNEKDFFPFIDKYGQFKFRDWPDKIHSDADIRKVVAEEEKDLAAHPSPVDRDKFGGWTKGPKLPATGHFYVKKIDGKWWMVDPLGNLFWSHGVVRVTPSSAITPLDGREFYFENLPAKNDKFAIFYTTKDALLAPYYTKRGIKKTYDFSAANIYRKYGKDWRAKYAESAHRRLRSWGLNTIANSSDSSIFLMRRTPYIDRFELKPPEVPALSGKAGLWWPFPDVFSDAFRKRITECLVDRREQLNDPWCLGFFVDNEIHWGSPTTLSTNTIQSPADSAAKLAFEKFLKEKYSDITKLNAVWGTSFADWNAFLANVEVPSKASKDDLLGFNRLTTETYFKVIRDEIKRLAPNKLYMGCRFAGSNKELLKIAAKYCDVISYNIYRDDLSQFKLPEGIDKPVMIGEFHFGSTDRENFHPGLLFRRNQAERAQAYYDYVRSALEHPNFIGTHWHQFSNQATTGRFDGENFQVGFTSVADVPYRETIEKIREIGYNMYDIRSKK